MFVFASNNSNMSSDAAICTSFETGRNCTIQVTFNIKFVVALSTKRLICWTVSTSMCTVHALSCKTQQFPDFNSKIATLHILRTKILPSQWALLSPPLLNPYMPTSGGAPQHLRTCSKQNIPEPCFFSIDAYCIRTNYTKFQLNLSHIFKLLFFFKKMILQKLNLP